MEAPEGVSVASPELSGSAGRRSGIGSAGRFALCLAAPLAVGIVSGLATASGVRDWYPGLAKPGFTPPDSIFGPVWTVLYLLMGVSAWLVWRRAGGAPARLPLTLFLVQLALNGLWSVLFFGLRSPIAGLIEIVLLWGAIGATVLAFDRVSRAAALLLVPYWAWVSYAVALNAGIWWLNR